MHPHATNIVDLTMNQPIRVAASIMLMIALVVRARSQIGKGLSSCAKAEAMNLGVFR